MFFNLCFIVSTLDDSSLRLSLYHRHKDWKFQWRHWDIHCADSFDRFETELMWNSDEYSKQLVVKCCREWLVACYK